MSPSRTFLAQLFNTCPTCIEPIFHNTVGRVTAQRIRPRRSDRRAAKISFKRRVKNALAAMEGEPVQAAREVEREIECSTQRHGQHSVDFGHAHQQQVVDWGIMSMGVGSTSYGKYLGAYSTRANPQSKRAAWSLLSRRQSHAPELAFLGCFRPV
jgi:hypothetical protein